MKKSITGIYAKCIHSVENIKILQINIILHKSIALFFQMDRLKQITTLWHLTLGHVLRDRKYFTSTISSVTKVVTMIKWFSQKEKLSPALVKILSLLFAKRITQEALLRTHREDIMY